MRNCLRRCAAMAPTAQPTVFQAASFQPVMRVGSALCHATSRHAKATPTASVSAYVAARRGRSKERDASTPIPWHGPRTADLPMGNLLWLIIVILVILWLGGFVMHVGGGLIHLLLVIAVIVLIFQLITGRRAV